MFPARAYAAKSATSALEPWTIQRRQPTGSDVVIQLLYCGVCHSDLHLLENEWGDTTYPVVLGHEMIGRVTRCAPQVTRFRPGDLVGVGCLVDSDRTCEHCLAGLEQFCPNRTMSLDSPDRRSGGVTYGGFSECIVVDEAFVLRVPPSLNPARAAPLLCAGITTYSALRHARIGAGHKVGILGLGGLGHMAVRFAHAMGAYTVVLTSSRDKMEDARRLGADEVLLCMQRGDAGDELQPHQGTFHYILDTVPAAHDLDRFLALLRRDGVLTVAGAPGHEPLRVPALRLLMRRLAVAGTNIGGIAETQEMLDFCAEHGIEADVEVLPVHRVNEAMDRLRRGDVKYRFCLDLAGLSSTENDTNP